MLVDRHPEESVRVEIGHLDAIEALRAIALLWVVLFHYLLVRAPAAADPWNAWIVSVPAIHKLALNGVEDRVPRNDELACRELRQPSVDRRRAEVE